MTCRLTGIPFRRALISARTYRPACIARSATTLPDSPIGGTALRSGEMPQLRWNPIGYVPLPVRGRIPEVPLLDALRPPVDHVRPARRLHVEHAVGHLVPDVHRHAAVRGGRPKIGEKAGGVERDDGQPPRPS